MDSDTKPIVHSTPSPESHSRKNIALGTVLGYVSLALSVLYGLLFTPWIVKTIGESGYGLYTLSSSLINLFLIDFGLSSTVNAFLSKYKADQNQEKINGFLSVSYKLYFFLDAIIFAVGLTIYLCLGYIYTGLSAEELGQLKVIFAISGIFSLVSFPATMLSGTLSSYEEFIFAKAVDIAQKVLQIGLVALFFFIGGGLYELVIANVAAGLVAILLKWSYIRFRLHVKTNLFSKTDWKAMKEIFPFSIWSAVASICARLIFNVTPSILGIVSDSTNIAVFGCVSTLESYVYLFSTVMSGFFLPKIQRIKNIQSPDERHAEIENLAAKIGKIQAAIICFIVVGFASCGQEFIFFWMNGDETYSPAYWCLLMIISYQIVYVPQIVFYTAMYSDVKWVKNVAVISLLKAAINLALEFALGYFYGVYGVSIAITVSRLVEIVLLNIAYKRDLHVSLGRFFRRSYFRLLPAVAASLTVGLLLHFFLPVESNILKFVVIGLSVTFSYWILAILFMPRKDLIEFRDAFKSWRKRKKPD